ncbi:hypothetical protein LBMAG53_31650 [Planctomycetota bacterium]|nr:hypothetical protein LBMAG53_31650 [Planctomycetota bacterium]
MRLGFASADLTPGPELSLLGYDWRQSDQPTGNAGVNDPLLCRSVCLRDGPTTVVLVALDLCIISVAWARRLRAAVAQSCGCPAEAVLISCSHTHSGPDPAEPEFTAQVATVLPNARPGDDAHAAYRSRVESVVVATAARAAALTVPVRVAARSAPCGIAYGRRVVTTDSAGKEHVGLCWNPQEWPLLSPNPSVDPILSLLWFASDGLTRPVALWNLGAHPVVLGRTSRVVSADWPGAAAQVIGGLTGADSLFTLGPCGDTHPWIATQADPRALSIIGTAAGGLVATLAGAAVTAADQRLGFARKTLTLGGHELDLAALRIGPARLVSAPVELFAKLGADLRRQIPGPLLISTNTDGWTGYWPDADSFPGGGYEIDAARAMGRSPGDGEVLLAALVELAERV